MGALGLDPLRFLETRDPLERTLMLELGEKVAKYKQDLNHNLAVDIANCVGQLFRK